MNEFKTRIAAQREILRHVNSHDWEGEELFGLSRQAIDRWVATNRLDTKSELVRLVTEAGSKLFFLANKSQEQMTDDYQLVSSELATIADAITTHIG